ncbi:sterol desaturase family protein [Paraburkholderia phenoliruptrix]|uniref:sterol desaturase family protein n=1 Tax=Paraburkholderia phenoliruptrix TaxID=252970 RepID=UPI001C6EE40B|nr:sterol desaturase family protein [Paraburkholderia phenoliruptrix]MBW9103411.1 sterol desaturase family protein [Paraburkholderia phenoliruptrix]MBW9129580.1 sterol desaturase family protein [Paraburkholderia ginsengiterrae]
MQFDAELLLLAMAPVFLACIGWEAWHLRRTRPGAALYNWRDTLCNAALALLQQAADKLAWLAIVPVYAFFYDHYRVHTWQAGWLPFTVLFVAQDLLYYVFHRCSHRVRWLWAAHVVHHSSERLNFSTAFRQSLMYPLAGMWLFWVPLAVLGFPPKQIVAIVLINLGFQFFVHTQLVRKFSGRFAWVEYVFNTPSIHRVHHARNDRYIDRNYAGVLVIWDRLFGTYVDEDSREPPVYGIVEPFHTYNPLKATFHEWVSMAHDVATARGVRDKLRALFAPPAWAAGFHARRMAGATAGPAPHCTAGMAATVSTPTHTGINDNNPISSKTQT